VSTFAPLDLAQMRDQVALVTGAGGGIGRAVARRFQELGIRLALADLRAGTIEGAIEAGTEALVWTGDLTQEAQVQALFAKTLERYGRIDVVVNAAGLLRTTPLERISKAEWDQVLDANLGSAFLVCRECAGLMRCRGSGSIINFSSVAGQTGGILSGAHYAASKAAIISLTRSVAKYLAPYGVRCNALAPSGVETDMLREFSEEQQEVLRKGIPVGRFGTPQEIAEVVLWLASPASAYLTGQTININGGAYFG
jgi:3-oxoacyl-[acyl-carrier protein] reductase